MRDRGGGGGGVIMHAWSVRVTSERDVMRVAPPAPPAGRWLDDRSTVDHTTRRRRTDRQTEEDGRTDGQAHEHTDGRREGEREDAR